MKCMAITFLIVVTVVFTGGYFYTNQESDEIEEINEVALKPMESDTLLSHKLI